MRDFKGDDMGIRLDASSRQYFVIQRPDRDSQRWTPRPGSPPYCYPITVEEIDDYVHPLRSVQGPLAAAWSNLKMHNHDGYQELKKIATEP
jgi:hypothetical protein